MSETESTVTIKIFYRGVIFYFTWCKTTQKINLNPKED